jgi:hypothetical protein
MKHLVQFSTGAASAEVAWRIVARHGPADVVLMSADTLVEHPDNWRFATEVADRLGCEWVRLADGRTPMQVGRDLRVVPNNRMAVCSRVLKRELLWKYMEEHYDPANSIVYLGFDWSEPHRFTAAEGHWAPWTVQAPLMDPPYLWKRDILDGWRERGIEPSVLYAQGFQHSNCAGACVRGGQAQWSLLLQVDRTRYLDWENEEQKSRDELGKDVSILRDRTKPVVMSEGTDCDCAWAEPGIDADDFIDGGGDLPTPADCPKCHNTGTIGRLVLDDRNTRPLTLRDFRERIERQPSMFDADDWGACGCFMTEEAAAPAVTS